MFLSHYRAHISLFQYNCIIHVISAWYLSTWSRDNINEIRPVLVVKAWNTILLFFVSWAKKHIILKTSPRVKAGQEHNLKHTCPMDRCPKKITCPVTKVTCPNVSISRQYAEVCVVGEIFNTERRKYQVHAHWTFTAKIYMPTVKINLPWAFWQCYVLALRVYDNLGKSFSTYESHPWIFANLLHAILWKFQGAKICPILVSTFKIAQVQIQQHGSTTELAICDSCKHGKLFPMPESNYGSISNGLSITEG